MKVGGALNSHRDQLVTLFQPIGSHVPLYLIWSHWYKNGQGVVGVATTTSSSAHQTPICGISPFQKTDRMLQVAPLSMKLTSRASEPGW